MNQPVYRILYVVTMGGALGGALAFLSGRTTLAIGLWAVAFLCFLAIVGTAVAKGLRQTGSRPRAEAGPVVAGADAPASLDGVLGALNALNSPDLPYEVTAEPAPQGALVTVRWRIEELRWKSLFSRGERVYNWKMLVTLDAARAQYAFTEYQAEARHDAQVWPPQVRWSWAAFRGKTAGQVKLSVVMTSTGEVVTSSPQGPRTSWEGAVAIRPADAKEPVITTLRNHGWRPRLDWWGARLFER